MTLNFIITLCLYSRSTRIYSEIKSVINTLTWLELKDTTFLSNNYFSPFTEWVLFELHLHSDQIFAYRQKTDREEIDLLFFHYAISNVASLFVCGEIGFRAKDPSFYVVRIPVFP